MNSWKGHNYYTENHTKWAELMNLSTAEWGVGWLPSNVVALPHALNDSIASQYPENTTFIENAGQKTTGDRETEKIVFGATSGVVLAWALLWLIHSYMTGKLEDPTKRRPDYTRVDRECNTNTNTTHLEAGLTGARTMNFEDFKNSLYKYYNPIQTELEICEDVKAKDLEGEDVEAVTNLLRRMYELDSQIWSHEGNISRQQNGSEDEKCRIKSEAIWCEIRRVVSQWEIRLNEGYLSIGPEEEEKMRDIIGLFKREQYQGQRYNPDF